MRQVSIFRTNELRMASLKSIRLSPKLTSGSSKTVVVFDFMVMNEK
jgi:hypothetical protein